MYNVTIKIELINEETNNSLYERYAYIPKDAPSSRIDVTLPAKDLSKVPATKKAIFRISYGVDGNNSIIQAECTTDFKTCYEKNLKIRTDYAKDNFAIRPETFYATLQDNGKVLRSSREKNDKPLRIASGYDYNLTVVATQYRENNTIVSSPEYNTSIERWLRFITPGVCSNSDDHMTMESFSDGNNTTNLLELNEVGTYRLEIKDENWTAVDQNQTNPSLSGCLLGEESERFIPNDEGKVGCNITTLIYDMNLSFQPYKFNINLPMEENNIPNSSHPDFLYMMNNINGSTNDVAIQFEGEIIAQAKGGETTTNFTQGCVAKDINLSLISQTLSEDGIDQIIRTSPNNFKVRSDVNFTRVIRYNEDINSNSDKSYIPFINDDIIIESNKFLNKNNGSTHLQIRYNLNKNSAKTINPIQITFDGFGLNSNSAFSEANESNHFNPKGYQSLGKSNRNFYFTQIAPDALRYPKVNCKTTSTISTPLNVEIFCDVNLTYCSKTNIMAHTQPLSSPRASNGWYSSIHHNTKTDGGVLNLTHSAKLSTLPNPDTTAPLEFTQGRNGLVQTKFQAQTTEKVSVLPSDALLFHPNPANNGQPEYEVSCSNDHNRSQWTGIGRTGNILNINSNAKKSHKMDW